MSEHITNALLSNGLLDDEGYLLPPSHPQVDQFTKRLFQLSELQQHGVKMTPQDQARLKEMHLAFDYYQDALEDEANEIEGESGESEEGEGEDCDEDEDYSDEDDDDDDDDDDDVVVANPN